MARSTRRDVLRTGAALAATSSFGLTGCTSALTGSGSACGTPSDGVRGALPSGGDYEPDGEPEYYPSDDLPSTDESVSADYVGPDGAEYALTVRAYASAEAAQEAWGDTSDFPSGIGYVVEGRHVYFARTSDGTEDGMAGLLVAVEPLSESCVSDAARYT